jgi:hypothetical protein
MEERVAVREDSIVIMRREGDEDGRGRECEAREAGVSNAVWMKAEMEGL